MQQQDPVRQLEGFILVMGDVNSRNASGVQNIPQFFHQLFAQAAVQRTQRLIEHQ